MPEDLVQLSDIRGMVHCHTNYSDGKHTIEEMARGADALGISYLTITDHLPTDFYAGGHVYFASDADLSSWQVKF